MTKHTIKAMSHKKGRIFAFKQFILPLFVGLSLLLLTTGCSKLKDKNKPSILPTSTSDWESELSTLQKQLQDANATISAKERKIRELTDEIANLTQQVDNLITLNENMEEQAVSHNNDIAQKGQDFFNAVLSCKRIVFHTSEIDYGVIGRLFMERYGDQLLMASEYYPSNEYAISDFMLIGDPTLHKAESAQPTSVEDGIVFTLSCTYAIQPFAPLSDSSPWWAGNTSVYNEKEGWYKMSKAIQLKLNNDGYVTLVSAGTGI